MAAENESEDFHIIRRFSASEDGHKVVDLEFFDADNIIEGNPEPIVGIYSLRPADLAWAIAVGKASKAKNLRQYVEALHEPAETSLGGDFAPYH